MGSKIALQNAQSQEFSINHLDNAGAISINSSDIVVLDTSGNLLLKSPTGAIGYGTGSGGTVTQLTSKGTAVTLNKPTGQITTSNAALAANTYIGFAINNTLITASDTLSVNIGGNGALSAYDAKCIWCVAGQAYIRLQNVDSISRSDAVPINFSIIKGVTA